MFINYFKHGIHEERKRINNKSYLISVIVTLPGWNVIKTVLFWDILSWESEIMRRVYLYWSLCMQSMNYWNISPINCNSKWDHFGARVLWRQPAFIWQTNSVVFFCHLIWNLAGRVRLGGAACADKDIFGKILVKYKHHDIGPKDLRQLWTWSGQ